VDLAVHVKSSSENIHVVYNGCGLWIWKVMMTIGKELDIVAVEACLHTLEGQKAEFTRFI